MNREGVVDHLYGSVHKRGKTQIRLSVDGRRSLYFDRLPDLDPESSLGIFESTDGANPIQSYPLLLPHTPTHIERT